MRKLMQLFRANSPANFSSGVSVRQEAGAAEIYLYDVIDSTYGISAIAFASALKSCAGKDVCLYINSPGGDVFEARAIATAIKSHDGKVSARIDGLAASAATTIAAAATDVEIAVGSFYMIHNAWTVVVGDKNSMNQTASLLDKVDQAIVADYVAKTGKTAEEIVGWMNAETWFSAEEAVANGFADSMYDPEKNKKPKNSVRWDVSAYDNAPKALQNFAPEGVDETRERNARRLRLLKID